MSGKGEVGLDKSASSESLSGKSDQLEEELQMIQRSEEELKEDVDAQALAQLQPYR